LTSQLAGPWTQQRWPGGYVPIPNTASPSPAENLSFWEACEELRYGEQSRIPEIVESIYQ